MTSFSLKCGTHDWLCLACFQLSVHLTENTFLSFKYFEVVTYNYRACPKPLEFLCSVFLKFSLCWPLVCVSLCHAADKPCLLYHSHITCQKESRLVTSTHIERVLGCVISPCLYNFHVRYFCWMDVFWLFNCKLRQGGFPCSLPSRAVPQSPDLHFFWQ